eukprot:TRINITY_DN67197_c0_g1_i1.p1 TRINITY_DN67197_c0_g1~~TRINITY_DN67197_c0_g1_i1.p1  ORF type:complete len:342 (+),score=46.02 TRINITY_DN67197_c0_g1_i1:73-1098(+)
MPIAGSSGSPRCQASSGKPRISLVERQKQPLEDHGSIKPTDSIPRKPGCSQKSPSAPVARCGSGTAVLSSSNSFCRRQDTHLARTGRDNAIAASRQAVQLPAAEEDDMAIGNDGAASTVSVASITCSLHPSVAGSTRSMGCSETTIGAGDDTGYWDYQHRSATKGDLGHRCRECKLPFNRVGEPITERRGARVSMRYHAECFSGFADPRSQSSSSHHVGHLAGTQFEAAPQRKARSKMRTGAHFDSGGMGRYQQRQTQQLPQQPAVGKLGNYGVHGGGFGAKSSKPGGSAHDEAYPQRQYQNPIASRQAPGDLTEDAVAKHVSLQSVREAAHFGDGSKEEE